MNEPTPTNDAPPPADTPNRPVAKEGERGIALLIVLLLVMILLPFTIDMQYMVSTEATAASNIVDQLRIENALDGQFELVLAQLRHDAPNNESDSYADAWNDDKLLNREDKVDGSEKIVQLQTAIFDEQGKLNLRNLVEGSEDRRLRYKKRLADLIRFYRRDTEWDAAGDADEVAEDIYRFLNGDAARGNVPKPDTVNGFPMLSLDDLHFASEKIAEKDLLVDIREGEEVAPGLHRYLTIHGDARLSLNTADKRVLMAYFPENEEVVDAIIDRRNGAGDDEEESNFDTDEEGSAEGSDPFTDPAQLNEVEGITPQLLSREQIDVNADFTVLSNFFAIRLQGTTPVTSRFELAVVERVPAANPEDGLDGFRFLLRQERNDVVHQIPDME